MVACRDCHNDFRCVTIWFKFVMSHAISTDKALSFFLFISKPLSYCPCNFRVDFTFITIALLSSNRPFWYKTPSQNNHLSSHILRHQVHDFTQHWNRAIAHFCGTTNIYLFWTLLPDNSINCLVCLSIGLGYKVRGWGKWRKVITDKNGGFQSIFLLYLGVLRYLVSQKVLQKQLK